VFLIAGLLVSATFTYFMLFTEQTGALVLPPVFERPVFANIVLAVHAAIALGLVVYRWRQSFND
jgi:hypothetical protein